VSWLFSAIFATAVLHVLEEYAWRGGFPAFMKRMAPRFASAVTTTLAVVVLGAFLLLCLVAAVSWQSAPALGLSVAALLIVNALTHVGGAIRARGYAPGLVTGTLLYLPLGAYGFQAALAGGWVTSRQALLAGLLGLGYAAVPPMWLGLASVARRRRPGAGLLLLLPLVAACAGPPQTGPQAPASASPTPLAAPPTDAPGEPVLVLTGGTLIDGTGAPPMPDAVVVIRGSRILAVGRRMDATIPAGARVIDVAGSTILPGLINAHVHTGYDAANLRAWAQAGVTAVRDLGVAPWDDAFVRRNALSRDPVHARLVAAGPLLTVPGGYPMVPWGMAGLAVTSPEDAILQTNRLLDAGADIIKIALDSGGVFGRQIPILSPAEAAAIVQTAHARGVRVSAHVLQTGDLARALDAGVDDIAHMVEDELPDALIGGMVAAGTYWVPTLELWQRVGLPGKRPVTNLGRFVKAGGQVALGTDYAGYAAAFDLGMPVTEIGLMAEAGMTPMQIIIAATKNAAAVCGLDRELGTLETGKRADVLVVDGDPLADLQALTQTRLVLRDGVIIRQEATPAKPVALATATPTPVVETPAVTPDIAATVVAVQQPVLSGSYLSPDGKWRAEVVVYPCVETGEPDENAYEQLRLTQVASGDERIADSQLQNCGGLGAFGLAGLFWSPNSRYFYYTDAREGVPDGCGYWERPILRLEPISLNTAYLGAGPLSPDGARLATWQERELVVWDIDGGEVGRIPAIALDAEIGPIAWSPDGRALAYLQVASYCPVSGKSYLVRANLPKLEQALLLESEAPTFGSVQWEVPDQLRLFDGNGEEWRYDLRTQELSPLP